PGGGRRRRAGGRVRHLRPVRHAGIRPALGRQPRPPPPGDRPRPPAGRPRVDTPPPGGAGRGQHPARERRRVGPLPQRRLQARTGRAEGLGPGAALRTLGRRFLGVVGGLVVVVLVI